MTLTHPIQDDGRELPYMGKLGAEDQAILEQRWTRNTRETRVRQIEQAIERDSRLHLNPGQTYYMGYHEWLVHPDEAATILARGYVIINGVRCAARKVSEVGGYPQIQVYGLNEYGDASDPQCPSGSMVGWTVPR